jgi:hypothetical protein
MAVRKQMTQIAKETMKIQTLELLYMVGFFLDRFSREIDQRGPGYF